jgi:tripeptidyl-peptidase I
MADLQQRLTEISTTNHPSCRQHVEKQEVDDLLKPSTDTTTAISSWLEQEGDVSAENVRQQGHWFAFTIAFAGAEHLLNVEFNRYSFRDENTTTIRTLEYSVPVAIRNYVTSIQPTTRFGQLKAQVISPRDTSNTTEAWDSADSSDATNSPQIRLNLQPFLRQFNATFCNGTITPACLRGIYNIGNFAADPK